MIDTQVISSSSVPPANYVAQTLLDQLTQWKASLLSNDIFLKLFINDVVTTKNTQLSDLVESIAPGYAAAAITTINGPYLDQDGNGYMTTPLVSFVCAGGGSDTCYGAYVVEKTGAAATVTFTESGGAYTAPVITSGGSGYIVPPKVTPTGATGSGAVLTAEITGGVVTGINIVDPGTGYTTATATIEAPNKLVGVANFATGLPLQQPTDAIQVVWEFDNLSA